MAAAAAPDLPIWFVTPQFPKWSTNGGGCFIPDMAAGVPAQPWLQSAPAALRRLGDVHALEVYPWHTSLRAACEALDRAFEKDEVTSPSHEGWRIGRLLLDGAHNGVAYVVRTYVAVHRRDGDRDGEFIVRMRKCRVSSDRDREPSYEAVLAPDAVQHVYVAGYPHLLGLMLGVYGGKMGARDPPLHDVWMRRDGALVRGSEHATSAQAATRPAAPASPPSPPSPPPPPTRAARVADVHPTPKQQASRGSALVDVSMIVVVLVLIALVGKLVEQ